jgi:RHS repeat-associated protein
MFPRFSGVRVEDTGGLVRQSKPLAGIFSPWLTGMSADSGARNMIDRRTEKDTRTNGTESRQGYPEGQGGQVDKTSQFSAPTISLPKGGGAIRGIGEKFAANPVTGSGSMTVPIAVSPGRSGFAPQLSLSYDSGSGNGLFGLGWSLSLPAITRKTDKGLPKYQDADESDVFILSGAEDLVPILDGAGQILETEQDGYRIRSYRPRIEGLFARIERWTGITDGDAHWRSISKENLLTIYGKDSESRISDPFRPQHIFSWLICETRDDKGNGIIYEYLAENSVNIDLSQANEANRGEAGSPLRKTGRYIKRIRYGNKTSLLDNAGKRPLFLTGDARDNAGWMFEVVLDYGDEPYHEAPPDAEAQVFVQSTISASPGQSWPVRRDPFSAYRSAFEVRTYRLCRRALVFHHFPEELGVDDYLVRSTEFAYDENPIASLMTSVIQSGYLLRQPDSYLKKSLPPVEFEYSKAEIRNEVQELAEGSLENLPSGLDGVNYQWIDLDGDGVAGVLTEQAGAWFYKRNLSPISSVQENGDTRHVANLAPIETVAAQPSSKGVAGGALQFLDLAGDGRPDLVQFGGPAPGFFEHTDDDTWESHRPFKSLPDVDWRDPNLKFVDLTGDGHADILISEDEVFTWYPSLAEEGFGPGVRLHNSFDEERGPHLIFADSKQSIFLADLSGDGMTDIVRIRNGEVCYWPNLGYGRFGAKVTMDNSPRFEATDIFDQRRIHLADIDGSGVTDIIYLASDGIQIYFNRSGNSWGEARRLDLFPTIDTLSTFTAVDLLGNGTACLVWSSPLPGQARRPMRYVDLMGGLKPYLMIRSRNNLGAETRVHYSSSTKFCLEDKYAGKPWLTKLPFPVQVVDRVETIDHISRNRFVTRYSYHHGYFDGEEREFRGFGMVEQLDTEEFAALSQSDLLSDATNIDAASHVPPVLTMTWFHTGAFVEGERVSKYFEREYYREGDPSLGEGALGDEELEAMLLPDTVLPGSLTADEEREACRSLKGSVLRVEIYALDRKEESDRPYSVSERNYTIKRLQPFGDNRHAVFFTHARESVDFHYERKLYDDGAKKVADPRVTHSLVLDVDQYGNVLRSADVAYGRRSKDAGLSPDDQKRQSRTHVIFTENGFTNAVLESGDYRAPLPCESRTYELLKVIPSAHIQGITNLFRLDDLNSQIASANDPTATLPYEEWDADEDALPGPRRRLIEHVRTLYRRNDLSGPLPLAGLESMALPFEAYKLAFTPELVTDIFRRETNGVEEDLIPDQEALLGNQEDGGYVHSEGDANWWIPSGQIFYSPADDDDAAQELIFARQHFFLPRRSRDPFGQSATVDYVYDLLPKESRDPLGNIVSAENDFRVLAPRLMTDPNGNRSTVAFDVRGMAVSTAVMGKEGENLGDSLGDFTAEDADPTLAQLQNFMIDPRANAAALLKSATSRILYDLDRYRRENKPPFAATLARETHVSDLAENEETKIQIGFSYSDGFGREIQKKIQAEPGRLDLDDPDSPFVNPRWVGSGWAIFNNKGKPVRQYEPFFDDTHDFKFARITGVSPILFYDPLERVIATLHPNHTWEKVIFDPWRQESWDVNDTALIDDPRTDPDVGDFFRRLAESEYLPTWYAQRQAGALGPEEQDAALKTETHAETPLIAHADSLERTFLTIAHNKFKRGGAPPSDPPAEEFYATRVGFDIEGNQREVIDANDRIVMRYDYDMLGTPIHQASMEAGERWMLNDVAGQPIRAWDTRGHAFRTEYDALRRPLRSFVQGHDPQNPAAEILFGRMEYGEGQSNDVQFNMRAKPFRQYDSAGVVTNEQYDFKGNLLVSSRRLAQDYKTIPDWLADPVLEQEMFTGSSSYDALNRPLSVTTPDQSVYRPTFNEANLLERVDVHLQGAQASIPFVTSIDYDAKGRRSRIEYGNNVKTNSEYDPLTFRLTRLQTLRGAEHLQDLNYTYDPAGNITKIRDDAQQTIYFNNQVVTPSNDYTYDAIYRLITAEGREHIGQVEHPETNWNDEFRVNLHHPHDGQAMRRYTERYEYGAVGNFLQLVHQATNGSWTRSYAYNEPSLIEAGKNNNRLSSTAVGGANPITDIYAHDSHGNMTAMPHLPLMQWNFKDQLIATSKQVVNNGAPETTYYVYDASGQRARKVTDRQNGTRKNERIYLGGVDIYREYDANGNLLTLERETLHVMIDKERLALVETRTQGNDSSPGLVIRYQFGNHLGSASLELDGLGQIISYEEYYPYGSASYQAVRSGTEAPKRYRYTGMERDEESGLAYHGARYYALWLGRWVSGDPKGLSESPNLFLYSLCNPIRFRDTDGMESKGVAEEVTNLVEYIHNGYQSTVAELRAFGFTDSREIGRLAGGALEGEIERAFGAGAVEFRYDSTGGNHRIDITFRNEKLEIELKLSPDAVREKQDLAFKETAAKRNRTLAYVTEAGFEIYEPENLKRSPAQRRRLANKLETLRANARALWESPGVSDKGGGPGRKKGGGGKVATAIEIGIAVLGSNSVSEAASNAAFGYAVSRVPPLAAATANNEGDALFGIVSAKYLIPKLATPTGVSFIAAFGSLALAFEESRRAAKGEKGLAEGAVDYWKKVQQDELAKVEREGHSVGGAFKYVGARFGQVGAGVIYYPRKAIVRTLEYIFD